MQASDLHLYRDPRSGSPLRLEAEETRDGVVVSGWLHGEGHVYAVRDGIPRFCESAEVASFGYQWNRFRTTQLDSRGGWRAQSEQRLREHTGWPPSLPGQRILEAGCGMGRFTEVLARTGAEVWSFDASRAVEANAANNGGQANVRFAQADLLAPPFPEGAFDKVLCVGVLQHTPSPRAAFLSLARLLRRGGEIAVDVYRLGWRCALTPKYALRPLTRRLAPARLHRLVRAHVAWVYPLTGALHRLVGARARHVSWALGMADYRGALETDAATARELAELDTFDMLSPAYDRPQTLRAVRGWMDEAGLVEAEIVGAGGLIRARARRPD